MQNNFDLSSIRTDTNDDLEDATALASRLLDDTSANLDFVTRQFSLDLLVAVLLTTVYGKRDKTLAEVLFFLADPAWDCAKQILLSFSHEPQAFKQKKAATWRAGITNKLLQTAGDSADSLVNRCYLHWKTSFAKAGVPGVVGVIDGGGAEPCSGIEVFTLLAVAKAEEMISNLNADKKASAQRILQNAKTNDGYRVIPDASQARAKLENAKARFENLIEPIDRLQLDLTLAAAMKPDEFRITPILLLGEPGIGKTYLATQLADALGVSTDKISAGGAQGGFQLTGSHTSWTGARVGSIATLLAEDKSASPVMVIDEVDKIGASSHYPVLPVLLDLLEPATARKFKDQFLDLEFDASRIIFILTANTLDGVPPALLSRVEVFHVPLPGRAQRLRIIRQTNAELCAKTKRQITMDEATCEELASRTDLDIRKLVRLVKEAFAKAMQFDQAMAELVLPLAPDMPEFAGDMDEEASRKPAGPTWKYH